jgi:hypothetical protein
MAVMSGHSIVLGYRYATLLMVLLWVLPYLAQAAPFTGEVVGISDGDIISVLRQEKAAKVRLYGVDTPEKRRAFRAKAKQFTSELVFTTEGDRDHARPGRVGYFPGPSRPCPHAR